MCFSENRQTLLVGNLFIYNAQRSWGLFSIKQRLRWWERVVLCTTETWKQCGIPLWVTDPWVRRLISHKSTAYCLVILSRRTLWKHIKVSNYFIHLCGNPQTSSRIMTFTLKSTVSTTNVLLLISGWLTQCLAVWCCVMLRQKLHCSASFSFHAVLLPP